MQSEVESEEYTWLTHLRANYSLTQQIINSKAKA